MARIGRPPYKATKHQRDRVMRLKAGGWGKRRIARRLCIDVNTLNKHFAQALEHAADTKREELLHLAEKGARRGNAILIIWLYERSHAALSTKQLDARSTSQPKRPKLGKKAEREQAAAKVGGIYAPPAPPKLPYRNSRRP